MGLMIDAVEARVLGSLAEKQLTTPEYYPMTLNGLTAACNQKTNREPVMALSEGEVMDALDKLRDKNLVYLFHGSTSRTVKYKHMMPSVLELEPAATAVMTLLLLRGPQTAGEMRGRSDRLYDFDSIGAVQETLDELAGRDEPLAVRLERQPGQKESRYAHLLSGPVDAAAAATPTFAVQRAASDGRLGELEAEIAELREAFDALRAEFAEFRKQFE